jgi:hypothetical protein
MFGLGTGTKGAFPTFDSIDSSGVLRSLVDQADVLPRLAGALDGVQARQSMSRRRRRSPPPSRTSVIAGAKQVVPAVHLSPCFEMNGTCCAGEDEADAGVVPGGLDDALELERVGGEHTQQVDALIFAAQPP